MTTTEKIYQLLYTRELENVELALYLAKSVNIDLLTAYKKLAQLLNQTDVQLYPYEAQEDEAKLLHALLFVRDIYFGQELYQMQAPYYYNSFSHKKKWSAKQLPEELVYLHFLKELKVFNPKLKQLPSNLSQLRFLKRIIIKCGQLKRLPKNLFKIASLERLNISWNQLTVIPPELGQLQNLKVLDFSYNELQELPETLANLNYLKQLNLEGNHLMKVPTFIYQLQHLVKLNLEENLIPAEELLEVYDFVNQNAERIVSEQFYETYEDYYTAISKENKKDTTTISPYRRSSFSEDIQQARPSAEIPLLTLEDHFTY